MKTLFIGVFAASILLPCATIAQQPGTARELNIVPTEKKLDFGWPSVYMGKARVFGTPRSTGEGSTVVEYTIPLDGSGQVEKRLLPQPSKFEGEIGSTSFNADDNSYRSVLHIWDKQTGRVDLRLQEFSRADAKPMGAFIPIGTVPLDPKSYKGSPLTFKRFFSPDSSKALLYFDDIQSGGIKLAMCWVVDKDGEPLWNGAYRIPVQALGAETTVAFTNKGQVLVEVSAVVLDEDNTREKKDGTVQAKVEKYYTNKTSTTLYLLHGDDFLSWDSRISNDAETTYIKAVDTPNGWRFLASVQKGKKKAATHEWVLGSLDAAFNPEVLAKGTLEAPLTKVFYTETSAFHALSFQDEDLTVLHISMAGNMDWQQKAPLTKEPQMSQFSIVADRLVYIQRLTKGNVKNLLQGTAATFAPGALIPYPTLVVWKDGTRTVTPLISLEASGKETPEIVYVHTLCEEGVLMRMRGQKSLSMTFVPIAWD